jgi:hypothetical protein
VISYFFSIHHFEISAMLVVWRCDAETLIVESTTSGTEGSTGTSHGGGVKGVAAAIHGVGEKIRGKFNKGVDDTFDESSGSAKNASIAREGDSEIASGNFSTSTKTREGALPGDDYEKLHQHGEMSDLNRE